MLLRKIFKSKIFLPFLFMLIFSLPVACKKNTTENPATVTLKQAEQIIFVHVLNSNDSGRVIYELPRKITAGDTVKAKGGDSVYAAQSDSWFFFIDDHPNLRWVHPCRYAFVACEDGQHTVMNGNNEPEIIDSLVIVKF